MKVCAKCKESKDESCFHKQSGTKDGLHTVCRTCGHEYAKQWYAANKEREKNRKLEKAFGITIEEYRSLLKEQNGCCAICGQPESKQVKSMAVDHDHITGKVRSLLCSACNCAIGLLQDDPELARKAADYLDKHKECKTETVEEVNEDGRPERDCSAYCQ